MRVRRLEITHFRGIRSMDWRSIADTAALIGPGDAGKSTVLDALERVLSPRWNYVFDDSDFYGLDTSTPIVIRATLVDLPKSFLKENKFGLVLQVFDDASGTAVAPSGDEDEVFALVVELRVDDALEPQWNAIDSKGEAHPIHARDREALGMLRVGGSVDVHLGWSRGSVLTRVTESGDAVAAVIADATRRARAGLAVGSLDRLKDAAQTVERLGRRVGASVQTGLGPHLDVGALAVTGGSLSLHDGGIPVRRAGLGTRRLLAMAMQHHVASAGGLTLVDEFEHGLEPHRIRQLLRRLRGIVPETGADAATQLVLTTHSPVVISELQPPALVVARRAADGVATLLAVPQALHGMVSKTPQALVAARVVVAEGPTEVGLLRSVERVWENDGTNFAYFGAAIVNGEGSTGPEIAGALHDLGYAVALFADADRAKAKLSRAKGARQILWPDGLATENTLAADLSDEGFIALVDLAHRSPKVALPAHRSIRDSIAAEAGMKPAEAGDDLSAWTRNVPDLRAVFGRVAKSKAWFKSFAMGEALGDLVVADWDKLAGTKTRSVLEEVRAFAERG